MMKNRVASGQQCCTAPRTTPQHAIQQRLSSNRRCCMSKASLEGKRAVSQESEPEGAQSVSARRSVLASIAAAGLIVGQSLPAHAFSGNPFEYKKELQLRRRKVPESEFSEGPQGLKYYDLEVGTGAEAKVGSRVAVHYELKFRNITFNTSRMGLGVTGGNPLGFDVGTPAGDAGSTLAGLDLGVRGMRVGGIRKLIVPPELGYGSRGLGEEIPPNSTLTMNVELLSIKTSPLGFRTRLVEG